MFNEQNSHINQNSAKGTGRTITLKLPQFSGLSVQTWILVLLIGVGGLQTAQLYGLKTAVSEAKVKPAISTSVGGAGVSGTSLPTMVGGC